MTALPHWQRQDVPRPARSNLRGPFLLCVQSLLFVILRWATLRFETQGKAMSTARRRDEVGGPFAWSAGERRPTAGGEQGVHFAAQALALSAFAICLWAIRNYFVANLDWSLTFMLQSKAGLNKSFFAMEFKREGQGGVQTR